MPLLNGIVCILIVLALFGMWAYLRSIEPRKVYPKDWLDKDKIDAEAERIKSEQPAVAERMRVGA